VLIPLTQFLSFALRDKVERRADDARGSQNLVFYSQAVEIISTTQVQGREALADFSLELCGYHNREKVSRQTPNVHAWNNDEIKQLEESE